MFDNSKGGAGPVCPQNRYKIHGDYKYNTIGDELTCTLLMLSRKELVAVPGITTWFMKNDINLPDKIQNAFSIQPKLPKLAVMWFAQILRWILYIFPEADLYQCVPTEVPEVHSRMQLLAMATLPYLAVDPHTQAFEPFMTNIEIRELSGEHQDIDQHLETSLFRAYDTIVISKKSPPNVPEIALILLQRHSGSTKTKEKKEVAKRKMKTPAELFRLLRTFFSPRQRRLAITAQ